MSAIKLLDGVYHIGANDSHHGLDCNPYLIIDRGIGVLIDPGSVLDFEIVYANLISLIPLEHIKYVILHHEDPDFCGALPLFEAKGLKAELVTSWRNMTLIQYYGVSSTFYLYEDHGNQLKLPSGKKLAFIPTPYLHFAGSFVTYDLDNKLLFSSDLFGAFSYNHTFYADEDYLGKMVTFHEHYMPSNQILRPVMEMLSRFDIDMILPQHGSIIKENIALYINTLKETECGSLLFPIKLHLLETGGYRKIFDAIYKRLKDIFAYEEVSDFFKSCQCFIFDENDNLIDYQGIPNDIWEQMFRKIAEQKSSEWLLIVEPLVKQMSYHYDIPMPTAFDVLLSTFSDENKRLSHYSEQLEGTIRLVNERLIKCPITGLYNESFFKTLLLEELEHEDWRDVGAYACVDVDEFSKYKLDHGTEQGKDALNSLIYLVGEVFGANVTFKMDNADLGLYLKGYEKFDLIEKLDTLRINVSKSDMFLSPLTISIGVVFPSELKLDAPAYDFVVDKYLDLGFDRMRQAKHLGANIVCFEGTQDIKHAARHQILLVDSDVTNLEIIEAFLNEVNITVFKATDGIKASEIAIRELPDLIISEVNLPRLDGFLLCEYLKSNSKTKNIPVVFLSYQKDEPSVSRAQTLGVSHYFKKPYLLYELLGIIKYYTKS